ncbi:MAG TPA: cytochrome c oxidase subunit 4 [Actinomycetota bacterium]|nr:cytochrome c oxidase subunit 4 [Actinomycetota bacterium]
MAEELRFFVRIGLFTLVAGAVYWSLTYEWAGTFLFGFVVIGCAFFAIAIGTLIRGTRPHPESEERQRNMIVDAAYRMIGFAQHPGDANHPPLAVGDEGIPPSSIWPLVAATAVALVGLGLVFGAWFWFPGMLLGAVTAYGWVTELVR